MDPYSSVSACPQLVVTPGQVAALDRMHRDLLGGAVGASRAAWGHGLIADAHGIFISADDRVFLVDRDETVTPAHDRERGFRHFAWVDLVERLGGSAWPALMLCALVGIGGVFLALTALDPRRV